MKASRYLLIAALACVTEWAHAYVISTNDFLPPRNGVYVLENPISFENGSGINTDFDFSSFTASFAPPAGLAAQTNSYIGFGPQHYESLYLVYRAAFSELMQFNLGESSATARVFDTEMIQMDISAGRVYFPGLFYLRESPTLQSTGKTTIVDLGNGNFQVESYFDLYTEFRYGSSETWYPSVGGPTRMSLAYVPEPNIGSLIALSAVVGAWRHSHRALKKRSGDKLF